MTFLGSIHMPTINIYAINTKNPASGFEPGNSQANPVSMMFGLIQREMGAAVCGRALNCRYFLLVL